MPQATQAVNGQPEGPSSPYSPWSSTFPTVWGSEAQGMLSLSVCLPPWAPFSSHDSLRQY